MRGAGPHKRGPHPTLSQCEALGLKTRFWAKHGVSGNCSWTIRLEFAGPPIINRTFLDFQLCEPLRIPPPQQRNGVSAKRGCGSRRTTCARFRQRVLRLACSFTNGSLKIFPRERQNPVWGKAVDLVPPRINHQVIALKLVIS